MLRRILFIPLLAFFCLPLFAQVDDGVIIKTYPLRFVYGLNGELTFSAKNGHRLSLLYQHHQRDYFVVPGYNVDFSSFPRLEKAEGYTSYFSYQFPVGDPERTFVWLGPRVGFKNVIGHTSETNSQGKKRNVLIDQQNLYFLGQLSLSKTIRNIVLEAYFHVGAVNIRWEATYFNQDGSVHLHKDTWENYWLPHFLAGFAVGYHF